MTIETAPVIHFAALEGRLNHRNLLHRPGPLRRIALPLLLFVIEAGASGQIPPLAATGPQAAEVFARTGATGMVVVVVRDGEVWMQSFGETRPGNHQAPSADSLLRLCSLSKILATDLLVKLAVDHAVALTDPLQKFAPRPAIVPTRTVRGPAAREITLGDLATHTAGLPREIAYPAAGEAHFTFPDHAFRWAWLPAYRLRTSPGTAAHYSNIGFDLLGDALEAASAKPYSTLFAERTAIPLGLRDTTVTPNAEQCARLLIGAKNEGPCTATQASAASGGMYSTANDMSRVLKYLLTAQNPAAQAVYLLPSQLRSVQGLDHAGPPTGIGLGWVRLGNATDPGMILQKTGGGAGFTTYIALNPARHAAIFVAATEGRHQMGVNLFRQTNNLLLTLSGLPPIPEPVPVAARPIRPRRRVVPPAHPRRRVRR